MILKKPFAFLIKYFRVIHFILLFFLIMFAFDGRSVLQFFNNYVGNNYQTSVVTDLHNLYAPISLIINVLVIIIISGSLLGLMIHKKKPFKLYLFTVLYYVIILVELIYVRGVLKGFAENLLAATTARSLRDIIFLLTIPQIIFIVSVLLRAIGFDFKKFDFASDLRQMNYTSKDAEEFEVNLNLDVYKVEQKSRRFLREAIYYIKENRFVVICLSVVGFIVLFSFLTNNIHSNHDVSYGMNKTFVYNRLNFTFQDAVISDLDYSGNKVEGKTFLAIKVNVKNESGASVEVDYNNFKLELGNRLITPTINDAVYFKDIASSNVPTMISHRSDMTFMLVYEISERDINRINRMVIHNGVVSDKGKPIDKHIYIKLKVQKLSSDIEISGNYSLNDTVKFDGSYLGASTLRVKTHSTYKRYIYKYNDCISTDNCGLFDDIITVTSTGNQQKLIIVFDGIYVQDSTTGYNMSYTTLQAFAENFCFVQYRVDDNIYTSDINLTPLNAANFIAFEVPQNIEYADLIQLVITVRNKRYFININP